MVLSGQDCCSAVGAFESPLAAPGEDGIVHSASALGTAACQGTTMVPVTTSESQTMRLKDQSETATEGPTVPALVDFSSHTTGMRLQEGPTHHNHIRRKTLWLGCPPPFLGGSREGGL